MSFPPRFLEDLRNALTLSEVVGGRVRLSRSNREFKGCCPFHQEKTPSFYVNDDKQFFHCFGCGAHGDILGFVMRADNLSFMEAVESLASKAGLAVPRSSPEAIQKAKLEKSLHSLLEESCRYYETALRQPQNGDVLNYVRGRGLTDETIASFRLGYAPDKGDDLRRHLSGMGYTNAQMIEASLLRESTRGGAPYPFFKDRVMFPVADTRGRIIAFSARMLPEDMRPLKDASHKPPKYINSTDTPLFHKGKTLYGQQYARMADTGTKILVVEGQLDTIACHQAGFKGAVAPLGTALTEEQIAAIWKMTPDEKKEPILCFDGDNAGYRAAQRAAQRVLPLLKADQSVRFSFLPEGDDPDTFLKKNGSDAFSALLDKAMSLLDFLWTSEASGDYSTPESRAGLSARLDAHAAKIQDGQVQYHYRQGFRDKTRALFSAPKFEKGKWGASRTLSRVTLPPLKRQSDFLITVAVAILMNHPEIYHEFSDRLQELDIPQDRTGIIFRKICSLLSESGDVSYERTALIEALEISGFGDAKDLFCHERVYLHAGFCRPATPTEDVATGFRTLWEGWDRSRLGNDIRVAGESLRTAMTPENESRIIALHQLHREND